MDDGGTLAAADGQAGASDGALPPMAFLAIMLAIALVLFLLPWPTSQQGGRMMRIVRGDQQIALVGPSTVYYVSPCDGDRRPLSTMIADETGRPVSDRSAGGQEAIDSIDLAAATVHGRAITDVILPLAWSQSDDLTVPDWRRLAAYRLFTPGFPALAASDRAGLWAGLAGARRPMSRPYRFAGRDWPGYDQLSATQFAREKTLTRCPEALTHDPAFTRGYYWWTHVAKRPNPMLAPLIGTLNRFLASHGRRLHVVLLPINGEVLERFQAGWGRAATAGQHQLAANLRAAGVPVLDLTDGWSAGEFGSPWCACAHFNASGRTRIAHAVAVWLRGDAIASPGAAR